MIAYITNYNMIVSLYFKLLKSLNIVIEGFPLDIIILDKLIHNYVISVTLKLIKTE